MYSQTSIVRLVASCRSRRWRPAAATLRATRTVAESPVDKAAPVAVPWERSRSARGFNS